MQTRQSLNSKAEFLVIPGSLPENKLPCSMDVLKYYYYLKKYNRGATNYALQSLVEKELRKIWESIKIPIMLTKPITNKIKRLNEKYEEILLHLKKRPDSAFMKHRIEEFKSGSNKLFDICKCQCQSVLVCKCDVESKIVQKLEEFMWDQRNERKMTIQQAKRKLKDDILLQHPSENDTGVDLPLPSQNSSHSDPSASIPSQSMSQPGQMRVSLRNLIMAMNRTGVSQRNTAIIANAVLQDVGLITTENYSLVIDKTKIAREQKILQDSMIGQQTHDDNVTAIYFDGRKDFTLVVEQKGTKKYRREIKEEHVTILEEPNSKYLGHVIPASGKSLDLMNSIRNFLETSEIDISKIDIIGCDGTVVNTGTDNGVIRKFEIERQKAVNWFICLLHANESPLRHLFEHFDGRKTGPATYSGPISKQIQNCEQLPVVDFFPIESDVRLPDIDPRNLSKDQQYLYQISQAVQIGYCSEDLANKNPGLISHARWLTTANRLLRLYIATKKPNKKLRSLVSLIIKVYTPVWFAIRKEEKCYSGAHHLFLTVSLSRTLSDEIKKVIDPVIQRNAYFAHPENLLLAMIVDDQLEIRIDALQKIRDCRNSESTSQLRQFNVPKLNFDAEVYTDLIYWKKVTEPPIIKKIPNDILTDLVMNNTEHLKQILDYPCHTQAVERHVKLVTEASKTVVGYERRHARICSILKSREQMPFFSTKKDFTMANRENS